MKKFLTLLSATLLLLGANQVTAQDWVQADFEIPAGGTTPARNGWVSWNASSTAVIANPEVAAANSSDYVMHFTNPVQWDIIVNYWLDPMIQSNIYSGVRLKVFVTAVNSGTGSKVNVMAMEMSHKDANGVKVVDYPEVKNTTATEVPVGAWTEIEIPFTKPVPNGVHRSMGFSLANYGAQAYFDDITFVAKTSGVVNQSAITVTGAGNATTITTAGGTLQMSAAILPADATDKTVAWSVSDKAVADIDGNTGILTAKGNGTCDVIAKSMDLQKVSPTAPEGRVTITVSNQATGIKTANTLNANVITSKDKVSVTSPKTLKQATIYTITGTEIANQFVNNKKVDISTLSMTSGIYILKLQSEDNEISLVKFVKK
jgi:uncharacterized protein YjdB